MKKLSVFIRDMRFIWIHVAVYCIFIRHCLQFTMHIIIIIFLLRFVSVNLHWLQQAAGAMNSEQFFLSLLFLIEFLKWTNFLSICSRQCSVIDILVQFGVQNVQTKMAIARRNGFCWPKLVDRNKKYLWNWIFWTMLIASYYIDSFHAVIIFRFIYCDVRQSS